MQTLALVARRNTPDAATLARSIAAKHPGRQVLAEKHLAQALGWPVVEDDALVARADLVIVLGGDGTLIHAARLLRGRQVPVLGVNLGSLGFMTEIPQAELFPTLDLVLEGRAQIASRMKLTCRLFRGGELIVQDEVLNDVVVSKGALARMAEHALTIDGQHVTVYKSDGLIISTPTGSTAYSLSANGPIVHPSVECMVVNPICPHALAQRPIVIPGEQRIGISLQSDSDVYLTLDGQAGHRLEAMDRVEVERAPDRLQLVRNPKMDYFAILRQKLHWGER